VSFDWDNYFDLALKLAGRDGTPNAEAEKRSAISRAYYAVLIQAREKASKRCNEDYPRGGTHHWTIKQYQKDPVPDAKRVGSYLKRLKKRRERADYDNVVDKLDKELESALQEAERLLKTISELPDTHSDH